MGLQARRENLLLHTYTRICFFLYHIRIYIYVPTLSVLMDIHRPGGEACPVNSIIATMIPLPQRSQRSLVAKCTVSIRHHTVSEHISDAILGHCHVQQRS